MQLVKKRPFDDAEIHVSSEETHPVSKEIDTSSNGMHADTQLIHPHSQVTSIASKEIHSVDKVMHSHFGFMIINNGIVPFNVSNFNNK